MKKQLRKKKMFRFRANFAGFLDLMIMASSILCDSNSEFSAKPVGTSLSAEFKSSNDARTFSKNMTVPFSSYYQRCLMLCSGDDYCSTVLYSDSQNKCYFYYNIPGPTQYATIANDIVSIKKGKPLINIYVIFYTFLLIFRSSIVMYWFDLVQIDNGCSWFHPTIWLDSRVGEYG